MKKTVKCPVCSDEFRYYLKFARHMLGHKWGVEKSLDYWAEQLRTEVLVGVDSDDNLDAL